MHRENNHLNSPIVNAKKKDVSQTLIMLHAFLWTAEMLCPLPTSQPACCCCTNTSPFPQTWQGQHLFVPSLAQCLRCGRWRHFLPLPFWTCLCGCSHHPPLRQVKEPRRACWKLRSKAGWSRGARGCMCPRRDAVRGSSRPEGSQHSQLTLHLTSGVPFQLRVS